HADAPARAGGEASLSNLAGPASSPIAIGRLSGLGRFPGCRDERLDQIEQPATQHHVLDLVIGADEFKRLALAQRVAVEALTRRFGETLQRRSAYRVQIVEEELHRHVEHAAQ